VTRFDLASARAAATRDETALVGRAGSDPARRPRTARRPERDALERENVRIAWVLVYFDDPETRDAFAASLPAR
jgi:hypothetical protein